MNNPQEAVAEVVTQADRDAAAQLYKWFPSISSSQEEALKTAQFIRDGGGDGWSTVQSYKNHRRLATEAAEAECARLREALEPNGYTKAAYIGEFKFPVCHLDEDGEEVWHPTTVPWDTIKEIMAAIRARATLTKGAA